MTYPGTPRNPAFLLPRNPEPGDDRPRNAFGILIGFGEAYSKYYDDKERVARQAQPAQARQAAFAWGDDDLSRASKGTRAERIARLVERLDARLPGAHRAFGGRYPKSGQHDRIAAHHGDGDGHAELVTANRTGTRFVYTLCRFGFLSRSGVTTSPRKGARWTAAVLRKRRLAAMGAG